MCDDIADALLPVVVAEKAATDRKLARASAFADRLARIHNDEHERVHAGQATPEVRDLIRRLHDELRAALADDREGVSLRQIARDRGIKPVGTDIDVETGKRVDDREGGE